MRQFQTGFEWNTITANEEFTGTNDSPTIQGTVVRSGLRAYQVTALTSGTARYIRFQFASANIDVAFLRAYVRFDTLPSAENRIIILNDNNGVSTPVVYLSVDQSGALRLYDEDGQIGSASSNLSTSTWYRVEIKLDRSGSSGSHIVEGKIDGTTFATASNRAISVGVQHLLMGGNLNTEAQTQANWYFDDVALNDNTGSYQNSYPGDGKIIELRPNGQGDFNEWADTSNAAGSPSNYTLVDEDNPNDATDFVQKDTANKIDMYALQNSGIGASDTVNVVMVGGKFRNNVADPTAAFRFRIEKTSGGTVAESADIVPNSTTWNPNSSTIPRLYPIVLYNDPDGSPWTQSTLDSAQAGVKTTVAGTNRIQVTTVVVSVDYTPSTATNINLSDTGSASDALVITDSLSVADTGAGTEALNIATSLSLNESGIGSETPSITNTLNTSDTGTGSDTPSVVVPSNLSDTGSGTESLAIATNLSVSDAGAGLDALGIVVSFLLSDIGAGADSLTAGNQVSFSDSGAGSDSISILNTFALSDNATGADSLSIATMLALADVAVGTETLNILNQFLLTESGSGVDNLGIANTLTLSDTGTAVEVINALATLALSDTGIGVEALNLLVQVLLSESALGADSLSISVTGAQQISLKSTVLKQKIIGTLLGQKYNGSRLSQRISKTLLK